jgi:hypothetical protein
VVGGIILQQLAETNLERVVSYNESLGIERCPHITTVSRNKFREGCVYFDGTIVRFQIVISKASFCIQLFSVSSLIFV